MATELKKFSNNVVQSLGSVWLCNPMNCTVETVSDFIIIIFFLAPKSLQMVIVAMKSKDAYSLEGKLWPT